MEKLLEKLGLIQFVEPVVVLQHVVIASKQIVQIILEKKYT